MKHLTALIALTALPGLALSHGDAGHGFMANAAHILTSAAHLWPLAVVAVVAAVVKRPVQRRIAQRAKRHH